MMILTIKCPKCQKVLREDSEEHYWHLKIHEIQLYPISKDAN